PGDSAAHRGPAAAATTSASMRRSTVMRSRATDGMSASECQGKRPDQAVKHRSDGRECREPSTLSHLASSQFRKRLPSMSVQGSSGESRVNTVIIVANERTYITPYANVRNTLFPWTEKAPAIDGRGKLAEGSEKLEFSPYPSASLESRTSLSRSDPAQGLVPLLQRFAR